MREMKDSGIEWIGEIPAHWSVGKTLYALSMPITDGPHETPELFDDGIPFVSAEAVSNGNGHIDFKHIRGYISQEFYDECCKKYIPEINDIYMIKSGATTGKVAKVETNKRFTIWSPLAVFRVDNNKFNYEYLYYFLQSDGYQKQIETKWTYGTQQNIGMRSLEKIIICFPSIQEQKRIADYLDQKCSKIDSIIEKQQKVIEKLMEYKLSIITEAVTKGLNPDVEMKDSGVEWIGMIPQSWSIGKLGLLFEFIGGFAFSSDDYVSETDFQVVRIGNVKNDFLPLNSNPVYISDEKTKEVSKFKVKEGYILFTMTGTKGKRDYFYTKLVKKEDLYYKELYINQRVGAFVANSGVYAGYYNYLLKENRILDSIFIYETGTANQGNLGIDTIRRTLVQVPPYEIQVEIADFLDDKCLIIDKTVLERQLVIEKLQEYKKSLIYEVATGKKEI